MITCNIKSFINIIKSSMKKITILSIASNGQLLISLGNVAAMASLESFSIALPVENRLFFDSIIGKQIDVSFGKAGEVRYVDEAWVEKGMLCGALKCMDSISESKVWGSQQKQHFKSIQSKLKSQEEKERAEKQGQKQEEQTDKQEKSLQKQQSSQQSKITTTSDSTLVSDSTYLNYLQNRSKLSTFKLPQQETECIIQYLSSEILLRYTSNKDIVFIPVKLINLQTMFECIGQVQTAKFLFKHRNTTIKWIKKIWNALKCRWDIYVQLSQAIQRQIIVNGWAKVNQARIPSLKSTVLQSFVMAESQSRANHHGIHQRRSQILSFIYTKNNFVGTICDIHQGYIYEILTRDGKSHTVELSLVMCPVGEEPGAWECRQFARKNLIGAEVNVYLKKDKGLNITGQIIRSSDSKDIEILLLQNGWAYLRQEYEGSLLTVRHAQFVRKSKEKFRGVFQKQLGVARCEDLTGLNIHKQKYYVDRRMQILKRLNRNSVQTGVLQGIIDVLHYKVWVQGLNILIKVRLDGVLGTNHLNPLLPQVQQLKLHAKKYYQQKLKKRSLIITITDYLIQGNAFLGKLIITGIPLVQQFQQQSLQELWLREGAVYAGQSAEEEWIAAQEIAKREGKGVWGQALISWRKQLVNTIDHQKVQRHILEGIDLMEDTFTGKFSWIEDGATIFIQPSTALPQLDQIWAALNDTQLSPNPTIIIGAYVAAPYFQDYYRAQIISIKGKKIKVLFMDYGNRIVVEESKLRVLPKEIVRIPFLCFKCNLFMIRPLSSKNGLDILREELVDAGATYRFRKVLRKYVDAYSNQGQQYINYALIEKGMAKADLSFLEKDIKVKITAVMEGLRKERIGIWQDSQSQQNSDQQEKEEY